MGGGEAPKLLLLDYKVMDSKIEKVAVTTEVQAPNGESSEVTRMVPGKVLAIRFKVIEKTIESHDAFGEDIEEYICQKAKDKNGQLSLEDAEFYAFSGSKIMIDQAINDFSPSDLPVPTVIKRFTGKDGKSYTKFT